MIYRRFRNPTVWEEVDRLQREMNRLFSTYQERTTGTGTYPAVNLWTGEDGMVLSSEIPGVKPEDLDISVVGDTITVSGERKAPEVGENVQFHRQERGYGRFSRTIQLPFPVEAEKVEASFSNGILKVSMPRAEADRPRKISVRSAA